jgi:hypothetical protein
MIVDGTFFIARGDASKWLAAVEQTLDTVAETVKRSVERPCAMFILLARDGHPHPRLPNPHGTTKDAPLARFEAIEHVQLKPLPPRPYDLALWKHVKLHRDCDVVFEQAFDSAPFRLVGQRLWVRGGSQEVRLYTRHDELVATPPRAPRPGVRVTHPDHLPSEKVPGAFWTRQSCRALAAEVGPATTLLVETLLADPVLDRLPRVIRLLKRRDRMGPSRLEAACARELHYGDLTYRTLTRILDHGLEAEALPRPPVPVPACTFIRTADELPGDLVGGTPWS